MKKIIAFLLALLMCALLTSCVEFEDEPSKETTGSDVVSTTTVAATTTEGKSNFSLNETAVFKNLKFTATEIKESEGSQFYKPESEKIFVGIKFTIENISDEDQTISSILLFEAYEDDVKTSQSMTGLLAFGDGVDGTIAPGKKMVGWYVIEASKEWSEIEVNVSADWLSDTSATFEFNK